MAAPSPNPNAKPLSLRMQYLREYRIWASMHQRCKNPKSKVYSSYGARGIRVCAKWSGKNGFRNFLADVGPQPFKRASLNRKNNNGNYTPGNVCWADPKTQARNMRSNHVITFRGKTMILVEWAEVLDMKPGTLGARLKNGWPIAKALTKPVAKRRLFSPWARRR